MRVSEVADVYGEGMAAVARVAGEADGWRLSYMDGRQARLAFGRWCGLPDATDLDVLGRCVPPVIDVGCGPGRLTAALSRAGVVVLGIDISEAAVRLTRQAGAWALHRSVFGWLPGEGEWATVLLMDGNVGIGGDPCALLQRCERLLGPGGRVLVELEPPGTPSESVRVRLESPKGVGAWFDWAHLGVDDVGEPAAAAGLDLAEVWAGDGRWFASLLRR